MTAAARVVLLVTSPRVAAGLFSAEAWSALHAGPAFVRAGATPAAVALRDAAVDVRDVGDLPPQQIADIVVEAARSLGTATWSVSTDGEDDVAQAIRAAAADSSAEAAVDTVVVHGSWDVPGARLLDVVATMHRLRSPGGCPWDAAQDHVTLAPYLLEEAYEAFQAIEDGDLSALREELGDVLLQVIFHARLAEELPEDERWSIDDVAAGLVDKLIRRHPHVFDGLDVSDADEVNRNWERIKSAERGETSPLANVPLAAPALTLAATLQRKAARTGEADIGAASVAAAAAAFDATATPETVAELLWAVVAAARDADVDAESALRARSRRFRDGVLDRPNG